MKLFNRTLTAAVLVAATATIIIAGGKNKGNNKNNTITNTPTESVNMEALEKAAFKEKWEEAEREKREAEEMLAPWTPKENLSNIIRSGSGSAPAVEKKTTAAPKAVTAAPGKDLKEKEAEAITKERSFLTSTQQRLEIVDEDAAFQKPAEDKKFAETVKTEEAASAAEKPKKAEEKVFSSSADAERANDERRKALILAYEQGAELSAADLEFLGEDAKHLKRRAVHEPKPVEPAAFDTPADIFASDDIAVKNTFDFSSVSESEIKTIHKKYYNREMLTEREMKIFEHTYVPRMPNKTLRANR